jgi:hypothetical protein
MPKLNVRREAARAAPISNLFFFMIICSLIFLFDVYPGASLEIFPMINENYPKKSYNI